MKLYINQKVFTYKDKFEIKNALNAVEYTAKGKILALTKRFSIDDKDGKRVAVIRKKIVSIFPNYKIKIIGDQSYKLKRKFTFFKHKYKVKPLDWELKGDFIAHNYEMKGKEGTIMSINKKWFKWGDTYELDIPNKDNALLGLCIAIAVDAELASDKDTVQKNK